MRLETHQALLAAIPENLLDPARAATLARVRALNPEVVYPIQALDGIANRCNGQLFQGHRTHIGWTAREVVLPSIPGSVGSGAIIKVAGITGRIRGMKYKRSDGQTMRPSLVVIAVAMGDHGCLSLFGTNPETHRLFADHLSAEYRVKTEGRGRTVDEWKMRPERADNHWFDCLVGCAVAASMQGVVLGGTEAKLQPEKKRVSFAALQRRRRA